MLLPVGRSGFAIAAGYLGLFAVIFFPAPLALLFGILAYRDIKRNPKKSGMGRAIFGIVFAAQVDSKWNTGDTAGAISAATNAKKFTLIGLALGLVGNLLIFGVYILAMIGAAAQGGGF